jgi:hypothetical protein
MLARTFYWFLLACEMAAIIFLIAGIFYKVRRIMER